MPIFGSPENGARTLIYASADNALANETGRFYFKSHEIETKAITHDLDLAARLWSASEGLCGMSPTDRDARPMAPNRAFSV
jgi:hypothetical protein